MLIIWVIKIILSIQLFFIYCLQFLDFYLTFFKAVNCHEDCLLIC